jgi:hypothetical protein
VPTLTGAFLQVRAAGFEQPVDFSMSIAKGCRGSSP